MEPRTVRLGQNRGKARLWLEGAVLRESGFEIGHTFLLTIERHRITLTRAEVPPEGLKLRRVSGKGDKPIIDVNTDDLKRAEASQFQAIRTAEGLTLEAI